MMVLYSKIVGAVVYEIVCQTKVGTVFELIYDPSSIALAGVFLVKGLFGGKDTVISATNLIEITAKSTTVLIDKSDSVQNLEDLIRLKHKCEKGYCGIGQKVFTKNGQYLGKVYDILIDSHSFELKKFYVKNLLSDRIIAHSAVIEFEPKRIVIKDDFETSKVQAAVETSTA